MQDKNDAVAQWFYNMSGSAMEKMISMALTLVIGVVLIKTVQKFLRLALEKSKLEKAAHSLILSISKISMYGLLGLSVAAGLGIDVTGIVALASVLTLAVSLALQNMLANVLGGFALLTTHPFHSGDYVEIGSQSGTVVEIGMTYTRLTTPDNKVVAIPNSTVLASNVVNYSANDTRRVELPVSASYDDNAIRYILRFWVKTPDYWDAYFLVNQRIKTVFDEQGIEMTYPHMNVHMKQPD